MTHFLCFFNFNNFKLGQNWREFGFLKAVNKRSVESKKFFNAKKKWKRIIWAHWSTFGSFRSFFKVIGFSFLFVSLAFTKKKGLHVHSVEIAEFFPSLFTWNQSWQIVSLKICQFYKFRSFAFWFLCVFTLLEAWNLPE